MGKRMSVKVFKYIKKQLCFAWAKDVGLLDLHYLVFGLQNIFYMGSSWPKKTYE
jgi:hypothetical protein